MSEYVVSDGVYPFDNIIGLVTVPRQLVPEEEAASALREAIRVYGHGVTVSL